MGEGESQKPDTHGTGEGSVQTGNRQDIRVSLMDYKLASILYRVSKMLMSLLEEEYGVGKKAPDRPRAVNHS